MSLFKILFQFPKNIAFTVSPIFYWKTDEYLNRWQEVKARFFSGIEMYSMMSETRKLTKTIFGYYKVKAIPIKGQLKKHIENGNNRPLVYVEYAITHFQKVPGIERQLSDIARIEKAGNEGERIFHNSIMELNGAHYVHSVLKMEILKVEAGGSKIFSPNRTGDKSCDILARNGKEEYYEVKDASGEIISGYTEDGWRHWTPLSPYQIEEWVWKKIEEADLKGADTLLCKVPVWKPMASPDIPESYDEWAIKVFKSATQIKPGRFKISHSSIKTKFTRKMHIVMLNDGIQFEIE